jgi:hypothetical protein
MLMKNDGGATVFALTEFRRMCGEAWAVLQGNGFVHHLNRHASACGLDAVRGGVGFSPQRRLQPASVYNV